MLSAPPRSFPDSPSCGSVHNNARRQILTVFPLRIFPLQCLFRSHVWCGFRPVPLPSNSLFVRADHWQKQPSAFCGLFPHRAHWSGRSVPIPCRRQKTLPDLIFPVQYKTAVSFFPPGASTQFLLPQLLLSFLSSYLRIHVSAKTSGWSLQNFPRSLQSSVHPFRIHPPSVFYLPDIWHTYLSTSYQNRW